MTSQSGVDMRCKELVELVTDYFEDRLLPEQRLRFEEHLHWCPPCVRYLEQMRMTILVVGRLTEQDIPSEARTELLSTFRGWHRHE
ncbi:MAG TPA: zf-HC2 domain-containing protein [Polyangiaceae bacterium]